MQVSPNLWEHLREVTEAANEALELPPVDGVGVGGGELRSGSCELSEDEVTLVGGAEEEAAGDIRLQTEDDYGSPGFEFLHSENEAEESKLAGSDGGVG
jgi:hypothetical protein